ncbi:hypothetical protein FB451DRAFT_1532347 [Mycena latifolia]|nr:hypothetical protein FB451DRAFT_1532347 [Mycena latifolia]
MPGDAIDANDAAQAAVHPKGVPHNITHYISAANAPKPQWTVSASPHCEFFLTFPCSSLPLDSAKTCAASLILCLRASPSTRTVAPPPRRSSSSSAPPPATYIRLFPFVRSSSSASASASNSASASGSNLGVGIEYHDAPRELLRAADKCCVHASVQLRVPTGHKCGWLPTRLSELFRMAPLLLLRSPLVLYLSLCGKSACTPPAPDPFRFLASVLRILLSPLYATFVSLVSAAAVCLRSSICISLVLFLAHDTSCPLPLSAAAREHASLVFAASIFVAALWVRVPLHSFRFFRVAVISVPLELVSDASGG